MQSGVSKVRASTFAHRLEGDSELLGESIAANMAWGSSEAVSLDMNLEQLTWFSFNMF